MRNSAQHAPDLGDFGRYELLFPIAKGGMGAVYAARARGAANFRKLVAIKTIRPDLGKEEHLVLRFENEARLAANISSPYVASTHDFGVTDNGTLFLAMDFLLGVSLSELFVSVATAADAEMLPVLLQVLIQMAQGLADAHEATDSAGEALGLVHRDISPHNVLVGVDGRARIVDFGVARAVQGDHMTQTGEVIGKVGYLAPEQLLGQSVSQQTDIFSLGIIAWELLSGKRLFKAATPWEGMYKVLNEDIPDLHQQYPHVPAAVAAVIDKALQRDMRERHASARIFATELYEAARNSSKFADVSQISHWVERCGAHRLKRLRLALQATQEGMHLSAISSDAETQTSHDTPKSKQVLKLQATANAPQHVPTLSAYQGQVPMLDGGQVAGLQLTAGVTMRTLCTVAMTLWSKVMHNYTRPRWWRWQLSVAGVLLGTATALFTWLHAPTIELAHFDEEHTPDPLLPSATRPAAPPAATAANKVATANLHATASEEVHYSAVLKLKSKPKAAPLPSRRPRSKRTSLRRQHQTAAQSTTQALAAAKANAPAETDPAPVTSPTSAPSQHAFTTAGHRWLRGVDAFDSETGR